MPEGYHTIESRLGLYPAGFYRKQPSGIHIQLACTIMDRFVQLPSVTISLSSDNV